MGRHRQRDLPAHRRAALGPDPRRAAPARLRPGGVRLVDVRGLRALQRRGDRVDQPRHQRAARPRAGRGLRGRLRRAGISFLLEGTSFLQALRQSRKDAKAFGRTTLGFVLNTSNPTLRAVFAEDSAALVGILIAGAGIVLHEVTGNAVYDAAGSIGVGLLLGAVAVVLIDRNRRFLIGEAVPADARARVLAFILAQPEVARVTYLHLEFVGRRGSTSSRRSTSPARRARPRSPTGCARWSASSRSRTSWRRRCSR